MDTLKVAGLVLTGAALFYVVMKRLFRPTTVASKASSTTAKPKTSGEVVQAVFKDDLKEGELRELSVADGKILLCKDGGEVYAIGNKCTHYAAPLKNGVLCQGRIRCPWHGAAFDLKTGDIEDFPCVDSIHSFPISKNASSDGEYTVTVDTTKLRSGNKRKPVLVKALESDKRVFALIGGGPSSLTAAQTLRENGFTGRIILIGAEKHLPYDRPKLSKAMDQPVERMLLRDADWFKEADIELHLGTKVTKLSISPKTVTLDNGKEIAFDKAFVATGGDARRIPIPGIDAPNVHFLRVPEEAQSIVNGSVGKEVVIVGSSFIGMEVALSILKKAKMVHVIGMEEVPFERVLGKEIGAALEKFHVSKAEGKLKFYMQRVVKAFNLDDAGNCTSVTLDDGTVLNAEICVVGAGIVPATNFLPSTISMARDRSILTNEFLASSCEDVFAGGDVARYQDWFTGEQIRVEHYGMAQYH